VSNDRMSRTDYSNLVEQLYRIDPNMPDVSVRNIIMLASGHHPSDKTLAYWKTICRKRGVAIPDRRRK
jgi:hypothetical protein